MCLLSSCLFDGSAGALEVQWVTFTIEYAVTDSAMPIDVWMQNRSAESSFGRERWVVILHM